MQLCFPKDQMLPFWETWCLRFGRETPLMNSTFFVHWCYGNKKVFAGIIGKTYSHLFLMDLSPRSKRTDFLIQEHDCDLSSQQTIRAVSHRPKRMATAVLSDQEPILRSAAKSRLSLCACIIPHSGKMRQAIGKVSLFKRIGDFFLCPLIPP